MAQYMLGTLSEEERARVEEGYFTDDAEFEELEIAEEELIDRYVRGELSQQESDQLEKTLATSPRLVERVQFARMFVNRLAPATVPAVEKRQSAYEERGWWQRVFGFSAGSRAPAMAVAFSVLLVLVGGAALLTGWLSLRERSRQLAAQKAAQEQRQSELDKQAADLRAQANELASRGQSPSETPVPSNVLPQPTPPAATPVVFLTLSAGATRSTGSSNSIRVLPGTSEVQLTLNLRESDYPSYRATVINADRGEVLSRSGLRPRVTGKWAVLALRIPAKQLRQGDYYVSVYGATPTASESVADYPFRVIK